ncbi:MAG TPA: hypothetical protein VJ914_17235 [Pseudonocardiaceae bacterium]|nr:hypothetical protein [Pseudonocardiaceae bacterium]
MRGKLVAALTIAAVCTLSCTAAATSAAPAHPGGTVHIIDYTNDDAAVTTAVLSGAIGDLGQGFSVNQDGTLSTEHNELNLVLSQGSFKLDIAAITKAFLTEAGTVPFQHGPTSCSGYMTASGTAPIIPGSGTGAYQGVSGTFHLTMTATEVDAPTTNDRCDVTGAMLGQVIVTEGTANISYSS